MDSILNQLRLGTVLESFLNKRIDPGVALTMLDSALAHLGVKTIGDHIQLRELCTKYGADHRQSDEDDENAVASGTTMKNSNSLRQERSLLFQPSSTVGSSASSGRGRKRNKSYPQRTWTVQLVCLASHFAKKPGLQPS